MNIIEQLRLTPKWGEFEKWWHMNYNYSCITGYITYDEIHYNTYLLFSY